jgi:hypothetical protein
VEAGSVTLGGETRTNWPTDGSSSGWTNLAFTGSGNVITGATATATTLTLERGTIEGGSGGFTNLTITGSGVVTGGTFTADGITLDRTDAWRMDSYLGPRQDLGAVTNLVWLPTKYGGTWAPPVGASFDFDTSLDFPRTDFKLVTTTTNSFTFGANVRRLGPTFTHSGTNLWLFTPSNTYTNWDAAGRAF